MATTSSSPPPLVFISHKHADSKIADVIRSFITARTANRVKVFQSSSPWADRPKAGRNLNKQLRETLWKTSVVILVYTTPDQDWSYCMWECGVASHPQSPDTRIILFQCLSTSPALFADQVNINVRNLVNMQQFVDDFLTSSDFFPGFSHAITSFQPHAQEVMDAGQELFEKLRPVLPPEKPEALDEWPAQPFLQLELGFSFVEQILSAKSADRSRLGSKVILKESRINFADKYCGQMFGVPSFPEGMTLEGLVSIWKERHPGCESRWVRALCTQILAAVIWQFPPVTWELMQSVSDDAWRAPMLNRVRKNPVRQCMQFDVYFYRFDLKAKAKSVQIEIPKAAPQKKKKSAATAKTSKQAGPAKSGRRP